MENVTRGCDTRCPRRRATVPACFSTLLITRHPPAQLRDLQSYFWTRQIPLRPQDISQHDVHLEALGMLQPDLKLFTKLLIFIIFRGKVKEKSASKKQSRGLFLGFPALLWAHAACREKCISVGGRANFFQLQSYGKVPPLKFFKLSHCPNEFLFTTILWELPKCEQGVTAVTWYTVLRKLYLQLIISFLFCFGKYISWYTQHMIWYNTYCAMCI